MSLPGSHAVAERLLPSGRDSGVGTIRRWGRGCLQLRGDAAEAVHRARVASYRYRDVMLS